MLSGRVFRCPAGSERLVVSRRDRGKVRSWLSIGAKHRSNCELAEHDRLNNLALYDLWIVNLIDTVLILPGSEVLCSNYTHVR